MQLPPAGFADFGQVATMEVMPDVVMFATWHDVWPMPTSLSPAPALPANGSYSPASPITGMVHSDPALTEQLRVKVSARGASLGAMPTTREIVVLRPPNPGTSTSMVSRAPAWASALAVTVTVRPDADTWKSPPAYETR